MKSQNKPGPWTVTRDTPTGSEELKLCVRCGSMNRTLDIDFHCSTCYRNLEAELARYKAALEQIADGFICHGAGCIYCEGHRTHPSSYEARIARTALDGDR